MSLKAFESDLMFMMMRNRKKYIKFSKKIDPDHWENDVFRWVYVVIKNYFKRYKKLPTLEVYKNELLKTSMETSNKKIYYSVIKKVYKKKAKSSSKYIEDNINEHLSRRSFLKAVGKAVENIEKSDIDSIKKKLLTNIILDETLVEDNTVRVLKDWKARQILRKQLKKIPLEKRFISTPYSIINAATQGIQVTEAATIAGLTSVGKSALTHEFGLNSLLEGLNVLHFPLENTKEQTAQRYDSRMTEVKYDTIKLYNFNKAELGNFEKTFEAISSSLKNDVVIKELHRNKTDILAINNEVELLKLDGFDVEFIIIDSCDIMASSSKFDSYRLDRASIYWDFKDYCKIKRIPGLTTTQLKATAKWKRAGVEDLAEAYDKARILDIVYLVSQTKEEFKDNIVDFTIGKNRDGVAGIGVKLFKDLSKMRFLEIDT